MKNYKNNVGAGPVSAQKGITLIALVITIIVMLILVAVTISMAINGGLFQKAGEAVGDTQDAIKSEQTLASGQIKVGDTWYSSIQDYLDNTPMGEGIILDEALYLFIGDDYNAETSTLVNKELTAVLNKLEGNVTWKSDNEDIAKVEGNGTTAIITAVGEGTTNITVSCIYEGITYTAICVVTVEIPVLKVGDYVNYTPTVGTYTVSSTVTGYTTTTEQSFETETGDSALKWRVLSIDEETGEVELVAATAAQVSTKLYLKGADGYNHGVDILNDLCETLYSNSNGATARSINVEDINAKTTYDYTSYSNYGTVITPGYKKYPNIYAAELGSTASGLEETDDFLGVCEGVRNSDGSANYSKYIGSSTASILYVTRTTYSYNAEDYLNSNLGINTAPAGLLNVGTAYWFATRAAGGSALKATFTFHILTEGGVKGFNDLFTSDGTVYTGARSVRPVIGLDSGASLTLDTENSTDTVTYWNIDF